jgi:hypothetical protein
VTGTENWGFCGEDCKSWRGVYDLMRDLTYSGRILKASDSYLSILIGSARIASNTSLSKVTVNDGFNAQFEKQLYDVRDIVWWYVKRVTTDL